MKNIIDICKAMGVEIPEGKEKDFEKSVLENYKAIADYDKLATKASKLEDDLKSANETLEKFKDIDPDKIADEIADYKKKLDDAEKKYKEDLESRDYNDAIDKLLDGIKFSSEAAKKSFKRDLQDNPLQLRNGAVLGFEEVLKQAKESDPSAFVDEKTEKAEQNKAKFTTAAHDNGGGSSAKTKEEIMAIKDAEERQAAIRENISLFTNTQ